MADAIALGDHIESKCTRCHDVTGHIVILMIDDEITKVECRACGSIHKYYPPVNQKSSLKKIKESSPGSKKVQKETTTSVNVIPKASSKKTKSQKVNRELTEQQWQEAINTSYGIRKPYTMTINLALGDIVDHPKFREGVVQELFPPDKAEILFREGIKLLKCSTN